MANGALVMSAPSVFTGRKEIGWVALTQKPAMRNDEDERDLQDGGGVLKGAAHLHVAQQDERADPDDEEREYQRIGSGPHSGEVRAEGHRRDGHRRGEADRGRNPAREEADRGMINHAEKMVFASGTGKGRAKFRIGKRAAQGAHAADEPERHDDESGVQPADLEPEAGENAGAPHIGDDDAGGREQRDGFHGRGRGARVHKSAEGLGNVRAEVK